jgi:hypothetical protein
MADTAGNTDAGYDDTRNRVELTELDVITRYSLAVRSATADRDELIAVLRADLDWLQDARRPSARRAAPARTTAAKGAPTRQPAKKTATRRGR